MKAFIKLGDSTPEVSVKLQGEGTRWGGGRV